MKALFKTERDPVIAPDSQPRDALAISLKNVSVSYGNSIAIDQANLDVSAGEITALVGPSGCGKSSLLASINRMTDLLPQCVVTGEIILDGMNVLHADTNLTELRQRVGMVFQQPNPFPLSIEENILFPLREHGMRDKNAMNEILRSTLTQVGLWEEVKDRLSKSALELSGGQQQRLCIARCLALDPQVILLDEPCSALDPISSKKVENLILSLVPKYTILVVTHNLAQARRIASHVAVCWVQSGCGCIIETGDTEAIFERPVHAITAAFCKGLQG